MEYLVDSFKKDNADIDKVKARVDVYLSAMQLVKPVIDEHGLEEYRSGAPFKYQTMNTKVDQHIEHIIHVADWLLKA